MPGYSVRKPLTVIMALLMVVVLGYVSFTNMTTDLLPNMDLPYVAIITTYYGQTPEKVELSLTKPLEQVIAATSGVKEMTSTSTENYSMILVELSEDVNMDSAIIEMNSSIDTVTAALDDSVGSPIFMKINPDLLPLLIAGINVEGKDAYQATEIVKTDVVPALERIDGVASVTTSGLLEKHILITLDQKKIDELNDKIAKSIDETLKEVEEGIQTGEKQLEEGKKELEKMKTTMQKQLAEGSALVNDGMIKLQGGISTIDTTLTQMETITSLIDTVSEYINKASTEVDKVQYYYDTIKPVLDSYENLLNKIKEQVSELQEELNNFDKIDEIGEIKEIEEIAGIAEISENETYYNEIIKYAKKLVNRLQTLTDKNLDYVGKIKEAKTPDEMYTLLSDYVESIGTDMRKTVKTLNDTKQLLEKQYSELSKKYIELENGKLEFAIQIANASLEIKLGEQALTDARKEFDEGKEKAYKAANLDGALTMNTISGLLSAENFSMPAGTVSSSDGVSYAVKIGDEFSDDKEMLNWVIFNIDAADIGEITIQDVATIAYLDNENDDYAKINGDDGMFLTVQKQSTYSTTDVSHRLNKAIDDIEKSNSAIHITDLSDQGDYIDLVVGAVFENLALGGILAVVILFLFLRKLQPTLVVAISIPSSLLFAVVLMYFSHVSLNIISLSGLALGIGMLVDNSIVVIENIYRLRALGVPAKEAAVKGAVQVAGAITASTLTTVSVFLPIVFTSGITKQLFTDMGLTITYSLAASLIVALTLVPAISSSMLKKEPPKEDKLFAKIQNFYGKLLGFSIKRKIVPLGIAIILLIVSVFGAVSMGLEFIPESDMKQMSVNLEMPIGSTQEQTREMTTKLIDIIGEINDVETIAAMQGGSGISMLSMGGGSGNTASSLYILLKEKRAHTSMEVGEIITEKTSQLDCTVTVASANMSMSMLTGSGVSIIVKGSDLDDISATAKSVAEILKGIEGTTDVSDGMEETNDELRIIVDKDKSMKYGLTIAQVYMQVSAALQNKTTATDISVDTETQSVVIAAADQNVVTSEKLMSIEITPAETATEKPDKLILSDIAKLETAKTLSSINHENQKRILTVSAAAKPGYNVGKISNQAEEKLKNLQAVGDCTVQLSGEAIYINDAISDLITMVLLAVAFIYMIMVAQFQSLKSPFIVLFTIPLAFTGGLLALWLLGFNLSVIAMLGFLILAGVIVNNGIVFVDYANQLIAEGKNNFEALVETGKTRLRPILMTVLTTVLGLITLALGFGEGSDMVQPMAIVVIFGLLYATLMTLFVVPVLYDIFNKKRKNAKANDVVIEKTAEEHDKIESI